MGGKGRLSSQESGVPYWKIYKVRDGSYTVYMIHKCLKPMIRI